MKKKMTCAVLSTAIVMGIGGSASPAYAEAAIELQDLYVNPDYVEIERLRDTKQIIVIKKEEIQEKGYKGVSDILKDIPSISVNATGLGDIDIRGQGSDQSARNIQILLDGAPITTFVSHPLSTNYDVVPVEQIEKIEIIPGGGSVLYGSGASGGIINITTNLRSMNKPKKTISSEWNSDGYRLNFNYGEKLNDKLTAEIGYFKQDRDLYFKDTYKNSEYFSAGFQYDAGRGQRLTFRMSHLEEEGQYIANILPEKVARAGRDYVPDYETFTIGLDAAGHKITDTRRPYLFADRTMDSYNIGYQKDLSKTWKFSSDLFYNTGDFMNSKYDDKKMDHETKGARLKFDHAYGGSNNLLIGLDLYEQDAEIAYNDYKLVNSAQKTYTIVPLSFNYNKKTNAVYLLNNMSKGKYTFTQGIRREKIDWNFDKVGNNIDGAGTSERWNTAQELSVAYHYNDTGRIYARYERGYTTPDGIQITDEVRVNGSKKYVGTAAKDEIFDLYEIGLRDKLGISTVNLTLFNSNTDNQMNRLYLFDNNGYLTMQTLNLLKTRRKGLDLSLRQSFGKLALQEGYAYLHGQSAYTDSGRKFLEENNGSIIDWTKSGLKKVPKHKGILKADYAFDDKFTVGLKYTYFGKYNNFLEDADKADGGVMQPHSLVDLDMKYKLSEELALYSGVTNLTNRRYYEYVGDSFATIVPGSERTYYFGMKYTFK